MAASRSAALGLTLLGAGLIVVPVVVCGLEHLDAPWIQGDEYIFLVNNPDVTGAGPVPPLPLRLATIFAHTHEDLYQPFTIATYAIEWSLWGERRVAWMRLTDVLLHALNALLVWAALRALLRFLTTGDAPAGRHGYDVADRSGEPGRPARASQTTHGPEAHAPHESLPAPAFTALAWALALLWAVHPMLASAWSADMGRTHLLSATFTLLAALAYVRGLRYEQARGGQRNAWFAASVAALVLAMLNKPVVGWVLIAVALEWSAVGLRAALRAPRVYVVAVLCAAFAVLTLWTTRRSLRLEDSPLPLFGDPLARTALGLWLYLRNFFVPGPWLASWYPPDIHTGWTHAPVWLGLFALIGLIAAAIAAARAPAWRGVTVGVVWFLATWLPISGLIGARVQAAQDRYLYLPAVGLLLCVGVAAARGLGRDAERWRQRLVAACALATLVAAAAIPWSTYLVGQSRSTLARALRVDQMNRDDPRVTEMLAAAYSFGTGHETLESRQPEPPDCPRLYLETLSRAAQLGLGRPEYFRDAHDRAAFFRRLATEWLKVGLAELSLQAALEAARHEPDHRLTLTRLAQAQRALQNWQAARETYQHLAQTLAPDAPDRGLRLIEYADLLLFRFNDPSAAIERYREALRAPGLPEAARTVATIGLARAEVLAGQGENGYRLISDVLARDPQDLDARLVVALYHLRSHHWPEAAAAYAAILMDEPTQYEALRGFHQVCVQNDRLDLAAATWQQALADSPEQRVFRAFWVWALAGAGDARARPEAERLLAEDADNSFALYALMLLATRDGRIDAAAAYARRAAEAQPLPLAREAAQATGLLRLGIERQQLPPEAALVEAAVLSRAGDGARAKELLDRFKAAHPTSRWVELADELGRRSE